MGYRLEEFPPEEGKKLTEELQEILKKYNAEMGTTSTITLFRRVETEEPTLSPIQPYDTGNGNETDQKA